MLNVVWLDGRGESSHTTTEVRHVGQDARHVVGRVGDLLSALIGPASLAILFRWKVNNPLLIVATAIVGLIALPLLQATWVMVK